MPHFWTCAGPTGSGKTHAATTFACERIPRNVKSAFIQPTIALCKQSYMDARARFPSIKGRIRTIVTRRGSDDKIRIQDHQVPERPRREWRFAVHHSCGLSANSALA